MSDEIKGFVFADGLDLQFEAIRNNAELTLKFLNALRDFWYRGVEPHFTDGDAIGWAGIVAQLKHIHRRSEAQKGNQNARKTKKTKANEKNETKRNETKKTKANENAYSRVEESKGEKRKVREKTDKKEFAPHVHLTETEHSTLVAKHGANVVAWCIDKLDSYKESSGKTYKSDAGAIRQWVLSAYEKEHPQANNRTTDDIVKERGQAIADDIEEIRRTHPEAQIL